MLSILITGKGFIGNSLYEHLKGKHNTTIICKKEVDYTDRKTLENFLQNQHFDFLINCSGYTGSPNVDACELNKQECLFYNVSVPSVLNSACINNSIRFINVSSGCIYTGYEKDFTEKDEPNFGIYNPESSYYSFTKHLCEKALHNTAAITIRIRMPFNTTLASKNLIYKILKYNNIIDLPNSGTNTDDLNVFLEKFIQLPNIDSIHGVLNVVNPGAITGKIISEYLSFHKTINPL